MIKGFIEVHNLKNEGNVVLINVAQIIDVWGNQIYMRDTEGYYIHCKETYEEIKQKIKEAVGSDSE